MRRRSKKLAAYERRAAPVRRAVIDKAGGGCEIVVVAVFFDVKWRELPLPREYDEAIVRLFKQCRRIADGCHERRKRSAGGSLLNTANLLSACNACNGWVEREPELARRMGLVVRSGDALYSELGRDHDDE